MVPLQASITLIYGALFQLRVKTLKNGCLMFEVQLQVTESVKMCLSKRNSFLRFKMSEISLMAAVCLHTKQSICGREAKW